MKCNKALPRSLFCDVPSQKHRTRFAALPEKHLSRLSSELPPRAIGEPLEKMARLYKKFISYTSKKNFLVADEHFELKQKKFALFVYTLAQLHLVNELFRGYSKTIR